MDKAAILDRIVAIIKGEKDSAGNDRTTSSDIETLEEIVCLLENEKLLY